MRRVMALLLVAWLGLASFASAQTREDKVRNDRKKVEADGLWIYNDLAKGIAESKKDGKPMLVLLRCVPCDECVKLDDELVNDDPRVKPLLEKFTRVRLVSANGLDLSLFQFDTDQSFAAFLMNADGTIYGRYGTRSHRTSWSDDVSVEGLAKALQGALDLHAGYPKNQALLAGRKGAAPPFATPEQYPLLKGKYTSEIDFKGKVVASCIHCHQIGDAQRQWLREKKEPIPESVLFPYPHPKSVGLILDPREKATLKELEENSPADKSGFKRGDAITLLGGQPLLSIADVQWVLHGASADGAELKAEVLRDGKVASLTLSLPKGWRQRDDISWRASSWGLRRMGTGGMLLEALSPEERVKAKIPDGAMALRAKHVGQFGPHAAAQKAGFRKDDVLVGFDGRDDLLRESDLLRHALTERRIGDTVAVQVLRDGKRLKLTLPMQP